MNYKDVYFVKCFVVGKKLYYFSQKMCIYLSHVTASFLLVVKML